MEFAIYGFELDFSSAESSLENIEQIDELLAKINTSVANIGATMNRLESAIESQTVKIENLTASRSTIMDADIAKESAEYVKNQILMQTTSALLSSTKNVRSSLIMGLINGMS